MSFGESSAKARKSGFDCKRRYFLSAARVKCTNLVLKSCDFQLGVRRCISGTDLVLNNCDFPAGAVEVRLMYHSCGEKLSPPAVTDLQNDRYAKLSQKKTKKLRSSVTNLSRRYLNRQRWPSNT